MTERRRDKLKAMFTRSLSKIGPGSTIYSGLRTSLSLLKEVADVTELPVLKGAVGGLLKVVEIIEKMAQNQEDAVELSGYLKGLEKLFNDAQDSKIPEPLARRIEELSQGIINIVQDIENIKSQSTTVKFFKNDRDASAITGHMQRINRLFSRFQFGSSVAIESQIMVVTENVTNIGQDVKVVTENMKRIGQAGNSCDKYYAMISHKSRILVIPRVVEARFNMDNRQRCLEGTRVELLDTVCRWALQNNSTDPEIGASIFWLCGQAGTGKTTVCSTVADTCHAKGQLGASFFFSRDREDRNNIRLVFPTIAYQLGKFSKDFEALVNEILRNDPDLVYSDPAYQLECLIINPLKTCISFPPGTVIVIDALDECKDDNPISTLLSTISKNRHGLTRLKFFISSRPENKIRLGFGPLREITQSLILHDIDTAIVNADIELYLRKGFSMAPTLYPYLVPEQGWPSDEEITSLVNKSSRLFIFAATALKFIMDESYSDPISQLTFLIEQSQGVEPSSSPFFYLDQMYFQVLRQAFPTTTPSDRLALLRKVLGAIVLIRNPLSPGDLEGLLGLRRGVIRTKALRHLHSFMVVPDTDVDTIRLIHPSFFDFITTERCPDLQFRINVPFHHEHLATLCFEQMESLKRNICEIKDTSKLNEEIEDLPQRIKRYIPPALQYACHHWVFHLCGAAESPCLQTSLDEFCHKKLLYWIEALSLLSPESLRDGIRHIQVLQTHVTTYSSFPKELLTILKDTLAFITDFFDPISTASLQLYRSALPLLSSSNSLHKAFSHELSGSVRVLKRAQEEYYFGVTVLRGHSRKISSAKFSPDEILVVSVSHDEVRLWDKGTGTLLKILMMGGRSSPVCFFQGRDQIISALGYLDPSIGVWDTTSGACLRTTELEGENKWIYNLTFFPDVTRIAGSADNDIMIWDVSNGSLLNTLSGHEGLVESIAFSPNHMLIASSSYGTIRIWDAVSGAALNILTGYTTSISFSPCSKFLVSGSEDGDLHFWDISHGITSKTFKGHSNSVFSVAFSQDGTQIISGSEGGELRVWNVVDSELLKTLRLGRGDLVKNVGFSIDGSQYICTWRDAIYIWNADHASNLNRREEQFYNIYFSPDGTFLITTMRKECHLLDGLTGDSIKVIKGSPRHVEFSPNNQFVAFLGYSTISLCDISSSTALRTLKGHSEYIRSVSFLSDSTQIVSTSEDKTVRIWDTTRGDNIFTVEADHRYAEFSPDGSQIIGDHHLHYDIPSHIRPDPVPLTNPVAGQIRYSIEEEWVFAYKWDKQERCIWLPADWRRCKAVSSRGRVAIGTNYGLVLLDLSDINLSI